ncbi:hypothetical protein TWF730_001817 [Orbilia blumenaviensis]|uniref:Uncharacterized protein n=1 Tax=Orbilia blumenaviensis TaxID=1796055 RepID=A0AAV9UFQ5_9PEZI
MNSILIFFLFLSSSTFALVYETTPATVTPPHSVTSSHTSTTVAATTSSSSSSYSTSTTSSHAVTSSTSVISSASRSTSIASSTSVTSSSSHSTTLILSSSITSSRSTTPSSSLNSVTSSRSGSVTSSTPVASSHPNSISSSSSHSGTSSSSRSVTSSHSSSVASSRTASSSHTAKTSCPVTSSGSVTSSHVTSSSSLPVASTSSRTTTLSSSRTTTSSSSHTMNPTSSHSTTSSHSVTSSRVITSSRSITSPSPATSSGSAATKPAPRPESTYIAYDARIHPSDLNKHLHPKAKYTTKSINCADGQPIKSGKKIIGCFFINSQENVNKAVEAIKTEQNLEDKYTIQPVKENPNGPKGPMHQNSRWTVKDRHCFESGVSTYTSVFRKTTWEPCQMMKKFAGKFVRSASWTITEFSVGHGGFSKIRKPGNGNMQIRHDFFFQATSGKDNWVHSSFEAQCQWYMDMMLGTPHRKVMGQCTGKSGAESRGGWLDAYDKTYPSRSYRIGVSASFVDEERSYH